MDLLPDERADFDWVLWRTSVLKDPKPASRYRSSGY
jgi:hypothetical protein